MITLCATWYLFCLGYCFAQIKEIKAPNCFGVIIFCPIAAPIGLGVDIANLLNKYTK